MTDKLIGTKPYQVPSNADLGDTAYQDAKNVSIAGVGKFDQLTTADATLVATNKPVIEPSLLLDFANSETVDSRITLTRESIATRTNRFGLIETVDWNVPRIDYDPVTRECKGFLIEEARTNLMTYSQDFTNSIWDAPVTGRSRATRIASSGVIAPDGSATAATYKNVAGDSDGDLIHRLITGTIGVPYTYSIWIKRRLGTGQIQMAVGDNVPQNITITSEWQRYSVTYTPTTTSVRGYVLIKTTDDEIDIWGAQVESGTFATSYIPTSGTAVTRESDVPSIPLSTWFNATEGTMYSEFSTFDTDNFGVIYAGSSTAGTPHLTKVVVTGGLYGACFGDGGSNTLNNTVIFPGTAKAAYAYKSGDSAVAVNSTVVTNSDTSVFAANSPAYIGCRGGDSLFQLNGYMKKLTYYPKRVSNTELQALTRI